MERNIKLTNDGSKTLFIPELNEGYHSHHGALQEARHVFIKNGLKLLNNYEINILELGYGTGLNALVTLDEILGQNPPQKITYFGIEKYPVSDSELSELGYHHLFENKELEPLFRKITEADWEKGAEILPIFKLNKIQKDFFDIKNIDLPPIDLVYFDCFGARVQPDLWEMPLFKIVSDKIKSGGILTTYSSKGSVRRVLQELGFTVEKRPGPPGKREMMVAFKN